jgi:hypothetical protein
MASTWFRRPDFVGSSDQESHIIPSDRLHNDTYAADSFRRIFRFRQFNAVQSKVFPSVSELANCLGVTEVIFIRVGIWHRRQPGCLV